MARIKLGRVLHEPVAQFHARASEEEKGHPARITEERGAPIAPHVTHRRHSWQLQAPELRSELTQGIGDRAYNGLKLSPSACGGSLRPVFPRPAPRILGHTIAPSHLHLVPLYGRALPSRSNCWHRRFLISQCPDRVLGRAVSACFGNP